MKSLFAIRTAILLWGAVWLSTCWADDAAMLEQLQKTAADPALSAVALKEGAKVAAVCAHCHGANGISTYPDTPNLAGQNPRYLLLQMEKFVDGRRRYEFMEGLIKVMTPQERIDAMLYYSRQSVPPTLTGDAALRARGKTYFTQVCFRCHGNNGHGDETYARLAGQQPSYVTTALKRYRNNTQDAARRDPLMAAATRLMTDEDIRAVVAYVASMP